MTTQYKTYAEMSDDDLSADQLKTLWTCPWCGAQQLREAANTCDRRYCPKNQSPTELAATAARAAKAGKVASAKKLATLLSHHDIDMARGLWAAIVDHAAKRPRRKPKAKPAAPAKRTAAPAAPAKRTAAPAAPAKRTAAPEPVSIKKERVRRMTVDTIKALERLEMDPRDIDLWDDIEASVSFVAHHDPARGSALYGRLVGIRSRLPHDMSAELAAEVLKESLAGCDPADWQGADKPQFVEEIGEVAVMRFRDGSALVMHGASWAEFPTERAAREHARGIA